MIAALLTTSLAYADDNDGDGWADDESPEDCNDVPGEGDFINPGEEEDGVDLTDEDCDGSITIRREFVSGFEGLPDFAVSGVVFTPWVPLGSVRLAPSGSGSASIGLREAIEWDTGVVHIVLGVHAVSGATCKVYVSDGLTMFDLGALTGASTQEFSTTGILPGSTLDDAWINCTGLGGSYAILDWITIQNGPYEWPPLKDVSFDFDDMGFPTGGRLSVVRRSEEYSASHGGLLLTGSDVGGLAWTSAHNPELTPTVWATANGRMDDWNDGSEFGVMDIYATWRGDESGGVEGIRDADEHDVYALTGVET